MLQNGESVPLGGKVSAVNSSCKNQTSRPESEANLGLHIFPPSCMKGGQWGRGWEGVLVSNLAHPVVFSFS